MRKIREFKNIDEFEKWKENIDTDLEIPVVIDDGWKIMMYLFTNCKSWETALRRFKKTFSNVNKEVPGWIKKIKKSCKNGRFNDSNDYRFVWDKEEQEKVRKTGIYSFDVEEFDDGLWYIYLRISGCYAGRKK